MVRFVQISAICQESGMHAVGKNRYVILPKDFEKGYQTSVKKPDTDFEFYKLSVLETHIIILLLGLIKDALLCLIWSQSPRKPHHIRRYWFV
ncbi:hypothetical protein ACFX15_028530 [Malus domestica]